LDDASSGMPQIYNTPLRRKVGAYSLVEQRLICIYLSLHL
jgi:hypothetical protein